MREVSRGADSGVAFISGHSHASQGKSVIHVITVNYKKSVIRRVIFPSSGKETFAF